MSPAQPARPPLLVRQLLRGAVLATLSGLLLLTAQGFLALDGLRRAAELQGVGLGTVLGTLQWRLGLSTILALVVILTPTVWFSLRLGRQLAALRGEADRLAVGGLDPRPAALRLPRELDLLQDSIQRLARGLSRQLQVEEDRRGELDALLAGLRDGVLALDRGGRVQACNPAARRLLVLDGHPVGGRLADLGAPAELLELLAAPWQEEERELLLGQGSVRELRVHTLPLPGAPGPGGERLLVVLTDQSTVNQVERLRREFVANVSHELKTPVTSIRGYTEMLRDGGQDEATTVRFLEVIERQARRLDAIIDDLLSLSRLERQKAPDPALQEEVALPALLAEVLEDHELLAREARVRLSLDLMPGTPTRLVCQRPLLERALINLLSNAIRYGRPESVVRLRALPDPRPGPPRVRLEVIDQGQGIAPEHVPRLFERFYVVDKARSRSLGGTGLGLAIVKHAAAVLEGEVGVHSEPGQGSTFWLSLPLDGSE